MEYRGPILPKGQKPFSGTQTGKLFISLDESGVDQDIFKSRSWEFRSFRDRSLITGRGGGLTKIRDSRTKRSPFYPHPAPTLSCSHLLKLCDLLRPTWVEELTHPWPSFVEIICSLAAKLGTFGDGCSCPFACEVKERTLSHVSLPWHWPGCNDQCRASHNFCNSIARCIGPIL